jgi:hypothetical protein
VVVANQTKLSHQEAWFILRPFEVYSSWDPGSEEARSAVRQKVETFQGLLQNLQATRGSLAPGEHRRGIGRRPRRKKRSAEQIAADIEILVSGRPRISRVELLGDYFGLPLALSQKRINKKASEPGGLYQRANASMYRTLRRLLARGLYARGPASSTYLLTESGLVIAQRLAESYTTIPAGGPGLKGNLVSIQRGTQSQGKEATSVDQACAPAQP